MLLARLPGSKDLCLLFFGVENNIDVQNVTQIIFAVAVAAFCGYVQRVFVSIFVFSGGGLTGQRVGLLKVYGLSMPAVGLRVNSY